MTRSGRMTIRVASIFASLTVFLAAAVAWLNVQGEEPARTREDPIVATPGSIERGGYLARAGNCAACHTDRGGPAYAGGKGIETPFGTIYSSNLTPDRETGIGSWSPDHFWRAMHHGRSKDGRLLYPAFPYPNYTEITRADSDALYAFLRSQPPARHPNRQHALRFPYDMQASLAVWRALFFRPATFEPRVDKSAEWNRGAYLVRGLGHCTACHSSRNIFGATRGSLELGGGPIPMQHWYAPSLVSSREAGVAAWPTERIVDLLKTGTSSHGSAMGPMAEVVFRSTQFLTEADLRSMAVFLKELPQVEVGSSTPPKPDGATLIRGAAIYKENCAQCHGDQGQGATPAYPALAGNRKVAMAAPANVIRAIVSGGFPPTTSGNPQPYGMPPFGQTLSDPDIAAVATYLRNSWGNRASAVTELDVLKNR